jgi:hypothetical protein
VAEPGGELKVFVSYAREDLAFADQLVDGLTAAGFKPLIDRHRMMGGEDFKSRLGALILECDTVAFVVTPDSIDPKSFCAWEIEETDRQSKRLIPVLCRPLGDAVVPPRLKALDYIFFYAEPHVPGSGFGNGLVRLTNALKADLGWLREHTALGERAARWELRKRDTDSLLRGTLLADAEKLMADRPINAPEFTSLQREYLESSRIAEDAVTRAERERAEAEKKRIAEMQVAQEARAKALSDAEEAVRQRDEEQKMRKQEEERRQGLRRVLATVSIVAVLGLGGLSYFLANKTKEAEKETKRADKQTELAEAKTNEVTAALAKVKEALDTVAVEKRRADEELKNSKIMQSRFLKAKAEDALKQHDYATAALVAMEGLPDEASAIDRPELPGLPSVLDEALRKLGDPATELDTRGVASSFTHKVQALIERAKRKLSRCLTPEQRKSYALDDRDPPEWCFAMGKWPYGTTEKPTEATTVAAAEPNGTPQSVADSNSKQPDAGGTDTGSGPPNGEPSAATTTADPAIAGNIPTKPTADQPTISVPGRATEGGDVLFGAQYVGFVNDRDVIRVGNEIGKFDRIRLRVLDNDIHINEIKVVYADGATDTLALNAFIPENSRTNWIDLKGDRFIKEIQLIYRSKPDFKGQSRIEVYGQYASGWIAPSGEGRKYNQGWVMLGAQTSGFVGFDKDVISVGRNEGGFKRIRITVRDRAVTMNELRVVYADGTDEVIPIRSRVEAGGTYGPIELTSEKRPAIDHIEAKFRSRLFDASAQGKGAAITEIWAQH